MEEVEVEAHDSVVKIMATVDGTTTVGKLAVFVICSCVPVFLALGRIALPSRVWYSPLLGRCQ